MPKDYPIEKCCFEAENKINSLASSGVEARVHQKWTCQHCNARQTMGEKNTFYRYGTCEECGQTSYIPACNYLLIIGGDPPPHAA